MVPMSKIAEGVRRKASMERTAVGFAEACDSSTATELQIPAGPSKLKRKGLKLLNKFCQWKYAIVTKTWPDELQEGMGGIGEVVRVWHAPFEFWHAPFEFSDADEPVYLLHPKSHLKHLKFT